MLALPSSHPCASLHLAYPSFARAEASPPVGAAPNNNKKVTQKQTVAAVPRSWKSWIFPLGASLEEGT